MRKTHIGSCSSGAAAVSALTLVLVGAGCSLEATTVVIGGTGGENGFADAGVSGSSGGFGATSPPCLATQRECSGRCVDVLVDSTNCGQCGATCGVGQICASGSCVCAPGHVPCGGICTNTLADPNHCGSCGFVCGTGQACVGGVCSAEPAGAGGVSGSGGSAAAGGATGGDATGGAASGGDGSATGGAATGGSAGTGGASSCSEEENLFSFFVTSYEAVQRMSGSADGFGGDLGGLAGADALCQAIAEYSTPCAANRQWRAFLSTVGGPVHAKDRIGPGPWYDRLGRVLAMSLADLLNERPIGADPAIADDLPNEYGVPNQDPDGTGDVDNHDTLTGTNSEGTLFDTDPEYTCQDWTSSVGSDGTPRVGHTWGTAMGGGGFIGGGDGSMANWMSALNEAGCAPGVNLIQDGGPDPDNPTVGSGGGYGGWYCFALAL